MDLSTTGLTPYQQLRLVRDTTGLDVTLKPFDRLDKVVVTDGAVAVFITTHKVRETPSSIKLVGRGVRMVSRTISADGHAVYSDMTSWEPEFASITVDQRYEGKTIDEYTDSLTWASMCARPGRGRLGQRDLSAVEADVARAWNRVHGTGAWEVA